MTNEENAYQAAMIKLANDVYRPVFFAKLAEFSGIVPQTEEEEVEFLRMGDILDAYAQQEHAKSASDRTSYVKQAADALLGLSGAATEQQPISLQEKQAAVALSTRPEYRDAALLYLDAMRRGQADA